MPLKRRTRKVRDLRVTPEAVDAYRRGAWLELHQELRLKPWECSPLDAHGECPDPSTTKPGSYSATLPQAYRLRDQIVDAIAEEDRDAC